MKHTKSVTEWLAREQQNQARDALSKVYNKLIKLREHIITGTIRNFNDINLINLSKIVITVKSNKMKRL
jgi:glycosidase